MALKMGVEAEPPDGVLVMGGDVASAMPDGRPCRRDHHSACADQI
jgi:hypothetical protein